MRRRLLLNQEVTEYGGIPIGVDNIYLRSSVQEIENPLMFVSQWIDTVNKRVTMGYQNSAVAYPSGISAVSMRTQNPSDYWIMSLPQRTVTCGKLSRFSVIKQYASYFFVKDAVTNEYLLKGNAVV